MENDSWRCEDGEEAAETGRLERKGEGWRKVEKRLKQGLPAMPIRNIPLVTSACLWCFSVRRSECHELWHVWITTSRCPAIRETVRVAHRFALIWWAVTWQKFLWFGKDEHRFGLPLLQAFGPKAWVALPCIGTLGQSPRPSWSTWYFWCVDGLLGQSLARPNRLFCFLKFLLKIMGRKKQATLWCSWRGGLSDFLQQTTLLAFGKNCASWESTATWAQLWTAWRSASWNGSQPTSCCFRLHLGYSWDSFGSLWRSGFVFLEHCVEHRLPAAALPLTEALSALVAIEDDGSSAASVTVVPMVGTQETPGFWTCRGEELF